MSKPKRRNQPQARPRAAPTRSKDTIPGENALEFLFNYRPKFTKLKNFEGSNGTRDPAQYDMHLHSQLILKDIILFPDMLKQLAGVVDSKLCHSARSNGSLPQVSSNSLLDPDQVIKSMGDADLGFTIGPEVDLQGKYDNLQKLSSVAASTLFAGLEEWSTIFGYSSKPISMAPCALADGYLSLDEKAIKKAKLPKGLDGDLKLVIKKGLSDFLFWEFKSMNAGSEGVMRAISHSAGSEFPWVRCPTSQSCGASFCRKPGNRFQFSVTGHKTGEDGDIMEDESGASTGNTFRFNRSKIDFSVKPVPDTSGWKFRCEGNNAQKSRVRRRSDDDPGEEDGETGGGDIGDDGAEDNGVTLPFTQKDFDKAKKIIQQIWAEAVNVDATFIVLNAGSREYIGIRDRKLQRLYLSPLIDLDNPATVSQGYFKIHTGLQITALVDAIQRAKKLHALREIPELYTFQYDRSEPYQDKVPNAVKTARTSKSTTTPREAKAEASKSVDTDEDDFAGSNVNFRPAELQLLQRLQDACSLKISWDAYIFGLGSAGSMTVTQSVEGVLSYGGTQMELHVVRHYSESAHSYSCYAADGNTTLPGIVIKVAPPGRAKDGLLHEHKMYNALSRIEGVAQSLGLVGHLGLYCETQEETIVLVLLDGGDRMTTKCRQGTFDNVYTQVKEAVRTMHFAKITHGNLTPENILVTKDQHTKKGKWNIHFISWKDGKYHGYLSSRKVCNNVTLERSPRRKPPLKAKPGPLLGKGDRGQERHDTDRVSSRTRRLKPRVLERGAKPVSRIFLTARVNVQQLDDEIEKDRKRLDSWVWNRH